ncbi:hypothetical protein LGQ02_02160 [Bacillus shivajii]|uniref:hypothetical protein n=1 Tax=Bacillus shivajii TaxID=1983719 RepID=UPI001CFA058F|nr:hypothetical protein [Bacillus shivajii]UCZ53625.1 hypothetical protein LGQ02_02160 [Bacillus shivajii]
MSYSKLLLIVSAIFATLGAFIGSHMAGAGSYALRPVHTHVLVVGWLSLFAWSVFYKVYKPKKSLLTTLHVWSAIIGTIGLTSGMYIYMLNTIQLPDVIQLIWYIVGGTILAISFILFLILAIIQEDHE